MEDRILEHIRALYKNDNNCYFYNDFVKTIGVFNDNYIEFGSNGDRCKNLSLDDYLDKMFPHLK